jgi:hypothetical protein
VKSCLVIINSTLRSGVIVKETNLSYVVELTSGVRRSFRKSSVAVSVPHNALCTARRMRENEIARILKEEMK